MSKFFGGKSPFDDPFFTEPLWGWFGGSNWLEDGGPRKQIAIEELNPEEAEPRKDVIVKNSEERSRKPERMSFRRVAYGGINGVYYSCSEGKRVGDGEVVLVEMNEEDMTIGESLHTISKGVHNKGHSVTTKRSSNGQVDTLQTLHNLNEDELASFEESWKASADQQFPEWNEGFKSLEKAGASGTSFGEDFGGWRGWDEWLLPSSSSTTENFGNNVGSLLEHESESKDDGFSHKTRRVVPVD